jgi:CRP-like cAMP-binding protein
MIEVAKLSAGESFGELALINDAKRAATVSCLTKCHFAILSREDFQKVLKDIEMRKVQRKVEFFRCLPFLQHWTKN